MNHALPSESYIARLDYLAFNGKVCSSVAYSDEQRFLEDLKESLYHGEPLCVVLYRDRDGKTIGMTAFAAGDPITVVNNLSDFIFGLIRAVGLILLGWGIVQVGLSFQSHDPSQRSNGFLTLAGGVVITFAKEIECVLLCSLIYTILNYTTGRKFFKDQPELLRRYERNEARYILQLPKNYDTISINFGIDKNEMKLLVIALAELDLTIDEWLCFR